MYSFENVFRIKEGLNAESENTVTVGSVRVSVITERLIRIEKNSTGIFCNQPTQSVLNRAFASPTFTQNLTGNLMKIKTKSATYYINTVSGNLNKIVFENGTTVSNYKVGNLKGTRRTLDMTFGKVKIGDGIISRNGVAIMDDSHTLILCEDGTVKPRKEVFKCDKKYKDIYCFAYEHNYSEAIRDYYKLTGMTPLIPRFALGNWWSRYYAYEQQEYLDLMQRFKDEKIPFTVATIDMDWHWVDVVKEFGKEAADYYKPKNLFELITGCYLLPGWTGYSWNTKLFPDYKSFLNELHDKNMKVTLNLHPAVGVRFFEDSYKEFAEFMGIDTSTKQQIKFDITDKKFIEGYFRFLHHGYEDDGVDFWWIDWQQEKKTKIEGLDPLWAVNHYHSLDCERDEKRPLILSRFAGYGSHRYPLGFSGDTGVTWSVLKFQPYFTATASNIGYSWWSHDIGGHHHGKRDDELYTRWLQFAVFSPILRLHSSRNDFLGKEPWKYSHEAESAAKEALRLRHRLIPYIYTANMRTHKDGIPLIRPMYYVYPEEENAYRVPNEYFFGSELIVAPITEKASKRTKMAGADVWLPAGKYTDIFTGITYIGGRKIKMYRDTWSIPVLAGEGAIIPLSADYDSNDWKNPSALEILIFNGNGNYTMYEDDGETKAFEHGEFANTTYGVEQNGNDIVFRISPVDGDISTVPKARKYRLAFRNIACAKSVSVSVENKVVDFKIEKVDGYTVVQIENIDSMSEVVVKLNETIERKNPTKKELLAQFLSKIQGSNDMKQIRFSKCLEDDFDGNIKASSDIKGPIREIIRMER